MGECVFNRVCPTGQAVSEGYESPMTVLVGVEPATPLLFRPKYLLLLLLCQRYYYCVCVLHRCVSTFLWLARRRGGQCRDHAGETR